MNDDDEPSLVSLQSFSGPYSMLHLMFSNLFDMKETDNPPALTIFHTFKKKCYSTIRYNNASSIIKWDSASERKHGPYLVMELFLLHLAGIFSSANNSLMGLQGLKESDHCYLLNSIFTKDIFSSSYIWQFLFHRLWQQVKIILIHL